MPPNKPVEISELWRGASSRAPWKRLEGQVDSAKNVRLDVTEGASNRNPTVFIADLEGYDTSEFDHEGTYEFFSLHGLLIAIGVRSDTAQTKVIHGWTEEGVPVEVVNVVGNYNYLPTDPHSLLVSKSLNTMIICNPAAALTMNDAFSVQQSINYIENGDQAVAGTAASFGGTFDTFAEVLEATAAVGVNGTWVTVEFDRDQDPAGTYVFLDQTELYPLYDGVNGSRIFTAADEVFPKHEQWLRIAVPDSELGRPTPSTWPQRLIYDGTTLYYTVIEWGQRLSGNQSTNPPPTLLDIGGVCRDVTVYQRRMLLLGEGTIVGSRAGQYFGFFIDNVNAPAEDDPLDLEMSFEDIGVGMFMVEIGERILIATESSQIQFHSGLEALTNINGRMSLVTRFQTMDVHPSVGPGSGTIMDQMMNIHRYRYIDSDVGIAYTGHLNLHTLRDWSGRDPHGLYEIERMLYVTDDAAVDTMVHFEFIVGDQVLQSAWSQYEFDGDLLFAYDWGDRHRLVIRDSTGFSLMSHVPQETAPPGNFLWWPRIDRLEPILLTSITYDESTDETTFQHSGRSGDLDATKIVLQDTGALHQVLVPKEILSNGDVVVQGKYDDLSDEPYIGFDYESELVLTNLFVGMTPREPLVSELYVFHHRSTDYTVFILGPDGNEKSSPYQSTRAGQQQLGIPRLESYWSEHTNIGDVREVDLRLFHEGPGQVIWTGITYYLDVQGKG